MAGEDCAYVSWVRSRACLLVAWGCRGRIEAHHAGRSGMGQRADDSTCIPLCQQHHREWHDASGYFRTMVRDERRAWAAEAIERTQFRYADSLLPPAIPF